MTPSKRTHLGRVEKVSQKIRTLERVLPADMALAREGGATLEEIAKAAGLTREGVRKILKRRVLPIE